MSKNIEELEARIARLEKANAELLDALQNALGHGIDLTYVEEALEPHRATYAFEDAYLSQAELDVREEELLGAEEVVGPVVSSWVKPVMPWSAK